MAYNRMKTGSVPGTTMVDELPEWKYDWGNKRCFFCTTKAQHSRAACEDHVSMTERASEKRHHKEQSPHNIRMIKEMAERRLRVYKGYLKLIGDGLEPKDAIAKLAKEEERSPDTINYYIRFIKRQRVKIKKVA